MKSDIIKVKLIVYKELEKICIRGSCKIYVFSDFRSQRLSIILKGITGMS